MTCDECGGALETDNIRGEVVCTHCSLVQDTILIDSRPEVRDEGESPLGHGPGMSVNRGASLATHFIAERDGMGHALPANARQRIARQSQLDRRVIKRNDRVTRRLFAMVSQLCTRLELPGTMRDRAFFICKQAYKQEVLRGQEFAVLVGASVYLTAREARRFVDMKNFLSHAEISRRRPKEQLLHAYIDIKQALGIRLEQKRAADMLPAVGSQLGLTVQEQAAALALLKVVPQSATKPEADLAGVIYRVAPRLSQRSVAEACGTSEVSLRNRWQRYKSLSTAESM